MVLQNYIQKCIEDNEILMMKFNPILHWGGIILIPPIDLRTPILLECPEWADFS